MTLLCAFEASARHQSFTAAAAELHLTQSAVSRQIRALEDRLGIDLFVRERQTVRLSPAGQAYAQEIRGALMCISNATLGLRTNPQGGSLNLAILPTFGTRWLAPRLPQFFSAHPGITINLNDTERILPGDVGVFSANWVRHSLKEEGFRCDFYLAGKPLPADVPHLVLPPIPIELDQDELEVVRINERAIFSEQFYKLLLVGNL